MNFLSRIPFFGISRQLKTTIKKLFLHIKLPNQLENNIITHKIARLFINSKQCDQDGNTIIRELHNLIKEFVLKAYGKQRFEFVLTPGGFLTFNFPKKLQYNRVASM